MTAPTGLTAAHLAGLQLPQDLDVSPDGRRVAFAVEGVSKSRQAKGLPSAVWVGSADGSSPARRWTPDTSVARQPRWSPDGHWLGFLSDRAEPGVLQVYRAPAGGGEAERVTDWQGGVEAFAWSPDSARIAFTARDEEWESERKKREESGDDAEVWGARLGFRRLRLIEANGGASATLSPADRDVTEFTWSPGGHAIAAMLALRPDLETAAGLGVDLVRIAVVGGEVRHLRYLRFGGSNLIWTRGGRTLLFLRWESGGIPSSLAVWAAPAEGGAPRCLTAGMAGCALAISRASAADAPLLLVAEGLSSAVYALDPESGRLTPVYRPRRGNITHIASDPAGNVLATVESAGDAPPNVWSGEAARGLRRLSDCNPSLSGIDWAVQEPFAWTAPDGWKLDGLVVRPAGVAGTPAGVVLVHGGPYARFADGFNGTPGTWAQWLALDGYAVFLPNPRGGMGHGHAFADTVAGEVGMADWIDVAAGTDAFLSAGHAEPDRLGIGGWSQGGFMTAWAASGGIPEGLLERGWNADYTAWTGGRERFRAGIVGAGPTDWGAMVSESDLPTFEAMLGGSRPGDGVGPHRHAVVSPLSHAARVRTPLLILHGRNDQRVPVGQATGFFHELRRRGVPAEMVLYPREPHGVRETAHQGDLLERVRGWYGRWL